MLTGTIYVAVRKTDGMEWFDTNKASGDMDTVRKAAKELDKKLPIWASANPFQRVARVKMVEESGE